MTLSAAGDEVALDRPFCGRPCARRVLGYAATICRIPSPVRKPHTTGARGSLTGPPRQRCGEGSQVSRSPSPPSQGHSAPPGCQALSPASEQPPPTLHATATATASSLPSSVTVWPPGGFLREEPTSHPTDHRPTQVPHGARLLYFGVPVSIRVQQLLAGGVGRCLSTPTAPHQFRDRGWVSGFGAHSGQTMSHPRCLGDPKCSVRICRVASSNTLVTQHRAPRITAGGSPRVRLTQGT